MALEFAKHHAITNLDEFIIVPWVKRGREYRSTLIDKAFPNADETYNFVEMIMTPKEGAIAQRSPTEFEAILQRKVQGAADALKKRRGRIRVWTP